MHQNNPDSSLDQPRRTTTTCGAHPAHPLQPSFLEAHETETDTPHDSLKTYDYTQDRPSSRVPLAQRMKLWLDLDFVLIDLKPITKVDTERIAFSL